MKFLEQEKHFLMKKKFEQTKKFGIKYVNQIKANAIIEN